MILILQPGIGKGSPEYRVIMDFLSNKTNITTRLHEEVGAQQTLIIGAGRVGAQVADVLRAGDVLVAIGSGRGLEQLDRRLSGEDEAPPA